MTVTNITNLEKFFEAVNKCEGKVELITEQGDRYNLKATLSQYVSLVRFFSNRKVSSARIVTANFADTQRIMGYMINN